jgi:hypothetical protein
VTPDWEITALLFRASTSIVPIMPIVPIVPIISIIPTLPIVLLGRCGSTNHGGSVQLQISPRLPTCTSFFLPHPYPPLDFQILAPVAGHLLYRLHFFLHNLISPIHQAFPKRRRWSTLLEDKEPHQVRSGQC